MKIVKLYLLILAFLGVYNMFGAPPKLSEGMKAFKSGDYATAERIFKENLDNNPKLYFVYPNLINALYYQKKYGEALFYIEKLKKFNNKIAKQQFKDIKDEVYSKILIENKQYEKAEKILQKAIEREKDPIIKNNLISLMYITLVYQNKYKAAEDFLKKRPNWENNALYLFYYSKLALKLSQFDDYYKYLGQSWTKIEQTNNKILKQQIIEDILDTINNQKDEREKLIFISRLNQVGIYFPEIENIKNEIKVKRKIAEKKKALELNIAKSDIKKAKILLEDLKNNYKVDVSKYEREIKTIKTKKTIVLVVIVVLILAIIGIIIIFVLSKGKTKAKKLQKKIENESLIDNENMEDQTIEKRENQDEVETVIIEKPEEVVKNVENEQINSESKKSESPKREEESMKKEEKAEWKYESIIKDYIKILDTMDIEKEKKFISKHKDNEELMQLFKILHFLQIEKYGKVLSLLKKCKKENYYYIKNFISELEKNCDAIEKAGICYLYYKQMGNEEKKQYYLSLGKRLKDEG